MHRPRRPSGPRLRMRWKLSGVPAIFLDPWSIWRLIGRVRQAEVKCLLCGGPPAGPAYPYDTLWNGRRFIFLACGACGATFIDPIPSEADFQAMYARSGYHDAFYEEVCEEGFQTSLVEVAHLLPNGGRMLDFGCGNGAYLIAATQAGYVCDGVELDSDAIVRAAAASGCEVFDLDTLRSLGRTYDVIHLGDVLEHLPAPAAMMRSLGEMLNPDGVFFVEGPLEDNASMVFYASWLAGWLKKRLRRESAGTFTPFHLTRTTARQQRRFFEHTLGCSVSWFRTFETGWPYPSAGRSLFRPDSAADLTRMAIARAAIGVARIGRPLRLSLGNRFTAIVTRPRA